jgi:hypothetical protein
MRITLMKGCLIALALLTFAFPGTLPAQVSAVDLKQTLERLRSAAAEVSPDFFGSGANDGGIAEVSRLKAAVDWLYGRTETTDPAGVSPEYLRSLQRAAELLKRRPSTDAVRDVTTELEAKVEHCRLLGVGMGGSVALKINTRSPSGPVSDWQVVYLLKIYEYVSGASPINFPRLSTPTDATVEPGRYWVWARDPATGRTSERALVRVVGQKELLVDLPVP